MVPTLRHAGRLVLVLLAGFCSTTSRGQDSGPIDARVGEASNQAGSGGYNLRIPDFEPGTANLYITGNVTGGRAFQGDSPINDPFSFGTDLPSSALSNFRRDSMSLSDVLVGRTAGVASPFYSRERTTTSLSTLSAGFSQYGANLGQDSYLIPQSTSPYTMYRFGTPYAPEMGKSTWLTPLAPGQTSGVNLQANAFLRPVNTYGLDAGGAESLYNRGLEVAPLGSELLVPAVPTSETLGDRLDQTMPFDLTANPWAVDLLAREADGIPTDADPAAVDGLGQRDALTGRVLLPELEAVLPATPQTAEVGEPAGQTAGAGDLPAGPSGTAGGLVAFAPTGADVYQDMIAAEELLADLRQHSADAGASIAALPSLSGQYAEAVTAARKVMEEPPDTYAGTANTAVQEYLRTAEALLRDGKYYQAESVYERARIIDRRNPLILLGQAQAMLAAGEYYSAAQHLARAIQMYPSLAFFKFDLAKFVTEPDLLEKRRADLESRLEGSEDYRFRFVLGYLEYYTGLREYGLENLRLAAEQAPEDSGVVLWYEALSSESPGGAAPAGR